MYTAIYGPQGNVSIWLDELSCNGNEQRLLDCTGLPIGIHNCGQQKDIEVWCSGMFLL